MSKGLSDTNGSANSNAQVKLWPANHSGAMMGPLLTDRKYIRSNFSQNIAYWVTQKLPQIYTANHATFQIRIRKIKVQICGNFWLGFELNIVRILLKQILFYYSIVFGFLKTVYVYNYKFMILYVQK